MVVVAVFVFLVAELLPKIGATCHKLLVAIAIILA